ncbi:MAG: glycosyltransferase [Rhodospirillaceae bacterium]|nr:glycosyltransferase [Rhodospirillaceae bacterium]
MDTLAAPLDPHGGRDGQPLVTVFLRDLRGGGAERMMLNLAAGMQAQGVAVELVATVAEGELLDVVPAGVPLIVLDRGSTLASIVPLARYLRRRRPAALLASQMHINAAALLAGALARSGTRIVVSERATAATEQKDARGLGVKLAHRMVPFIYPRAHGLIAVSAGVADDKAAFSRVPRGRFHVINNPVVTDDFPRRWDAPVDHPWFAPGMPPVVLGVGRLHPVKDFGLLIDAVARLRSDRDVRLVILGEGDERAGLEAQVRARGLAGAVSLPGFVIDALPYMRRAAVLALSSRREGSPNVLVEAMACGTPVVATDCPHGPREILEPGAYGPLVPVGDEGALAQALAGVLDAPPDRARLQARAGDFSIQAASVGYLDVLVPGWRLVPGQPAWQAGPQAAEVACHGTERT